ncbi:MAG: DUF106 domain-containing protein [Euryarchaeota archaeon]|nr:DUF106 domain-containing protein [Euryarchaeota archaeon]
MAIEKEQKPAMPKGQFLNIFLFMIILFILFDNNLRRITGKAIGFVLNPLIGFDHRQPILTILLASLIMIGASTLIRHFLVDWLKMARIQNTMRAYQKAMREARVKRDTKRLEQLQKAQPKLMGIQAEMSSGQMKPMAATMLVVIPMFAWLFEFVSALNYPFFSSPWNPEIQMFATNGIVFGKSILPHWILFYSAVSIPFGTLLQKALKFFDWRDRWHLMRDRGEGDAPPAS